MNFTGKIPNYLENKYIFDITNNTTLISDVNVMSNSHPSIGTFYFFNNFTDLFTDKIENINSLDDKIINDESKINNIIDAISKKTDLENNIITVYKYTANNQDNYYYMKSGLDNKYSINSNVLKRKINDFIYNKISFIWKKDNIILPSYLSNPNFIFFPSTIPYINGNFEYERPISLYTKMDYVPDIRKESLLPFNKDDTNFKIIDSGLYFYLFPDNQTLFNDDNTKESIDIQNLDVTKMSDNNQNYITFIKDNFFNYPNIYNLYTYLDTVGAVKGDTYYKLFNNIEDFNKIRNNSKMFYSKIVNIYANNATFVDYSTNKNYQAYYNNIILQYLTIKKNYSKHNDLFKILCEKVQEILFYNQKLYFNKLKNLFNTIDTEYLTKMKEDKKNRQTLQSILDDYEPKMKNDPFTSFTTTIYDDFFEEYDKLIYVHFDNEYNKHEVMNKLIIEKVELLKTIHNKFEEHIKTNIQKFLNGNDFNKHMLHLSICYQLITKINLIDERLKNLQKIDNAKIETYVEKIRELFNAYNILLGHILDKKLYNNDSLLDKIDINHLNNIDTLIFNEIKDNIKTIFNDLDNNNYNEMLKIEDDLFDDSITNISKNKIDSSLDFELKFNTLKDVVNEIINLKNKYRELYELEKKRIEQYEKTESEKQQLEQKYTDSESKLLEITQNYNNLTKQFEEFLTFIDGNIIKKNITGGGNNNDTIYKLLKMVPKSFYYKIDYNDINSVYLKKNKK